MNLLPERGSPREEVSSNGHISVRAETESEAWHGAALGTGSNSEIAGARATARQKSIMALDGARVAIVIIGYRTPGDIRDCLISLGSIGGTTTFAVVICENGGPDAFDALEATLVEPGGPCAGEPELIAGETGSFLRVHRRRLEPGGQVVVVADASENLGYAGGVNACIRMVADEKEWRGIWILNPDTTAEPAALTELLDCAAQRGKGMVGSRLMHVDNSAVVGLRGLRWRKLFATTVGVDTHAPVLPPPDPDDVEGRIDAPSGASFYVTRDCVERIGPMDERYFLYFEDLDWGLRAKISCGVGYAYKSVVRHVGGRSTGSAVARAARSPLSTYLEYRNRFIFVRRHYGGWLIWTLLGRDLTREHTPVSGRSTQFLHCAARNCGRIDGRNRPARSHFGAAPRCWNAQTARAACRFQATSVRLSASAGLVADSLSALRAFWRHPSSQPEGTTSSAGSVPSDMLRLALNDPSASGRGLRSLTSTKPACVRIFFKPPTFIRTRCRGASSPRQLFPNMPSPIASMFG